jgi:hypothetical protein
VRRIAPVAIFSVLASVLAACSSSGGGGPKRTDDATLIVGIQGEQVAALLSSVKVTTSIGGAQVTSDVLDLTKTPSPLPKEIKLTPQGDVKAPVAVHVEASGPGSETLVRDVFTSFVSGETKLVRVQLEAHCISTPLFPVSCPSGQTCLGGRCQDDTIYPAQLEAYEPSWAADAPDVCRPAGAGAPIVVAGTGQSDFLAITDGQTLQAQRGPQGGHHLWIALEMKNLKQSGSTTTITGLQPGTNVAIPPTAFVFTFEPGEGGYCKLFGLRYQLDNGGIDYHQFLGKPLDLTIKVDDTTGASASAVAHINVDPVVLGESDAGP